jgi:hypothetical protein
MVVDAAFTLPDPVIAGRLNVSSLKKLKSIV